MRSFNYNLKRLKENELAGPKTANAIIDFCLGMSSTSKYLVLNPNGRGSVNFDLDEGGLMADMGSQLDDLIGAYKGPFKLTGEGVEAGYVIVPGGSIIEVPSCEYSQMTKHTNDGLVQLVLDGHGGSYWSYSWHISNSYLVFDNCWTIIVGSWDSSAGVIFQRFYGDAYLYSGGTSAAEYNGPFKLWVEKSGSSWRLATNGGDVYNLEPYSGSGSVPVASFSPNNWSLPDNPNYNGQVVVLRITSSGFRISMVDQGYTVPANEIARIGMTWPVYVDGEVDHWEVLQEFQWGKSNVFWTQGYSFSQERLLSAQSSGLCLCLYMGDFGCWPISDSQVYFKGGTLTRRFGGVSGPTTTSSISSHTYSVSNGTWYLALLPHQRGAEASGPVYSFSSSAIIGVSLAVLADLSVSGGKITSFRPYAFRDGKSMNAKNSVVNYTSGDFLFQTASWHLEPYDDSHVVYYWWGPSGLQYETYSAGSGTRYELHWASTNHHSGTYSSQGVFKTTGDSGSTGVGGYTTKLAHWQAPSGSSSWQFQLYDDYNPTNSSYPSTTIPYFGAGWRDNGGILMSGGRIDCGWTSLSVSPSTMSSPDSSGYIWLSVNYSGASSSAPGTLTASWGHGSSLPSSTASTQVIEIARITTGSSGVVRLTPEGGFPGVDNEVLARYCQVFICGRCL